MILKWARHCSGPFLMISCRQYDIILKESIRFRAEKENSFIQKIKLLGMWFFPIVPIRGRAAGMYMGIVSFPAPLNRRILWKKLWRQVFVMRYSYLRACFTVLPPGGLEKQYEKTLFYPEAACILPSCFMEAQPHSGQMRISKPQTALSSSAMAIPA